MYDVFADIHNAGHLNKIKCVSSLGKNIAAGYKNSDHSVYMRDVSAKNALSMLAEDAKLQFEDGWWSTSAAEHGIRHELGHAIGYWYIGNSPEINKKISSLRKQVELDIGMDFWEGQYASAEITKKAGEVISYYALQDNNEFIAESIAEYMNGSPRETAQKVVKILLGKE